MAVGKCLHELAQYFRCIPVFSQTGSLEPLPEFLFNTDTKANVFAQHSGRLSHGYTNVYPNKRLPCRISTKSRDSRRPTLTSAQIAHVRELIDQGSRALHGAASPAGCASLDHLPGTRAQRGSEPGWLYDSMLLQLAPEGVVIGLRDFRAREKTGTNPGLKRPLSHGKRFRA